MRINFFEQPLTFSGAFPHYSVILYNAFLPLIVENLPQVREARGTIDYEATEEHHANKLVRFNIIHFIFKKQKQKKTKQNKNKLKRKLT